MGTPPSVVVVVVKPGTGAGRPIALLRWLRWLLPTALLVVSPTPIVPFDRDATITLDADSTVDAGPLAVADAIVKAMERH